MAATILTCTCLSMWQDNMYGPNRRVHTFSEKRFKALKPPHSCTVCGTWRGGPISKKEEK